MVCSFFYHAGLQGLGLSSIFCLTVLILVYMKMPSTTPVMACSGCEVMDSNPMANNTSDEVNTTMLEMSASYWTSLGILGI